MDTEKKQTEPIKISRDEKSTGKKRKGSKGKDSRETIGVDDKLIGDDLDFDEAERGYEKKGVLNNDNVY